MQMKVFKSTNNYFVFTRKDAIGNAITSKPQELIFSVKESFDAEDYIFQKKMTTGDITTQGNGEWQISIIPNDTINIPFGKYVCDVKVVDEYGLQFIIVAPQTFEVLDTVTVK